jgi:sulfur carrier protein ThiS
MAIKAQSPEIRVEVMSLGGEVKTVLLNGSHTVADALNAAGLPENSEVRCNGEVYSGNDEVENGDSLMVLAGEKPKGGSYA